MAAVISKAGMLSAPIPGSSLAQTPGNYPWEKPPKYPRPEEAADYIWERLMKKSSFITILSLLDAGAPATAIAKSILFSGVQNGMFTVDTAMIIHKVVVTMIAAIGYKAGIKVRLTTAQTKPGENAVNSMVRLKADREKAMKVPELPKGETVDSLIKEAKAEKPDTTGLMSKPTDMGTSTEEVI